MSRPRGSFSRHGRTLLFLGLCGLGAMACGSLVGIEDVVPGGSPGKGGSESSPPGPSCRTCGDACVDPLTDSLHCGLCSNACGEGASCIAGVCDRRLHGSPGARSACYRGDDGALRCWGRNAHGQLGRGSLSPHEPIPAPLPVAEGTLAVTDGIATCALSADGAVQCLGGNVRGNLGNGKTDGTVTCDGANLCELSPGNALLSQPADDLSAGGGDDTAGYLCARLRDRTVACWGRGIDRSTPIVRRIHTSFIASGNAFACALGFAGEVYCFGAAFGLAGGPTAWEALPAPVLLPNLPPLTVLGVGGRTICGSDGSRTLCFGSNTLGQAGDGATAGPSIVAVVDVALPEGTKVVQLAGGQEHHCALDAASRVFCWGSAEPVGAGDAAPAMCAEGPCFPTPVLVLEDVREVAAGYDFTLAVKRDGTLYAWGKTPSSSCVLVDEGGCAERGFERPRALFSK